MKLCTGMISVELWRARIGLFNCRWSPCCDNEEVLRTSSLTPSCGHDQFVSARHSVVLRHAVVLLFLAVVTQRLLLMISGDIELNPGPTIIELGEDQCCKHESKTRVSCLL